MEPFKVNILGEDYTVYLIPEDDYKTHEIVNEDYLKDSAGFCSGVHKRIALQDYKKYEPALYDTVKHEVIHAYQFESGTMNALETNTFSMESVTCWTATQLDRMYATSKEIMDKLGRS